MWGFLWCLLFYCLFFLAKFIYLNIHLKLRLAIATHNFKWLKTNLCTIWARIFSNFDFQTHIPFPMTGRIKRKLKTTIVVISWIMVNCFYLNKSLGQPNGTSQAYMSAQSLAYTSSNGVHPIHQLIPHCLQCLPVWPLVNIAPSTQNCQLKNRKDKKGSATRQFVKGIILAHPISPGMWELDALFYWARDSMCICWSDLYHGSLTRTWLMPLD